MKKKNSTEKTYFDHVHTWGRLWTLGAIIVFLSFPLAICLYFNVWPTFTQVMQPALKVMAVYWTTAVVEVLAFVPMMGSGASYLSFVSGNISNLKLPCALASMESAKVRPNTEEGEVISTIASGVSAIVTTLVIAAGVLIFSPFLHYFTDADSVFAPAFNYVLPALFGALGASYLAKHWRIAIAPVLAGVIILIFAPTMGIGTLMFPTIVVSIVGAFVIFKFQDKKEKKAAQSAQ